MYHFHVTGHDSKLFLSLGNCDWDNALDWSSGEHADLNTIEEISFSYDTLKYKCTAAASSPGHVQQKQREFAPRAWTTERKPLKLQSKAAGTWKA